MKGRAVSWRFFLILKDGSVTGPLCAWRERGKLLRGERCAFQTRERDTKGIALTRAGVVLARSPACLAMTFVVSRQLTARDVLKNLPVFRWADFPVSHLSFVSRWSAHRLVGLSLLSMPVRSACTSFRVPNGHGPAGRLRSLGPLAAAFA